MRGSLRALVKNVDPNYDAYRRQNYRLKVVFDINMYTFMKYDAGLSLWRIFSAWYSGYHVWRWHDKESPSRVQSSRPMAGHWWWASWSQPSARRTHSGGIPTLFNDVCLTISAYVYHCTKNSAGYPNSCWISDTIKGKCMRFNCCFDHYRMLAYKISACEVCIIWWKPTETKNNLPIAGSMTGKPAMITLKKQLDCFTVHDATLWENIFGCSHLGCETDSVFICFACLKYFKNAKGMEIDGIFENSKIWQVNFNQLSAN